MPRPKSVPRLWLDKDRETWSVIDGKKSIRTGCSKAELQGAKDFLAEYLTSHHTVAIGDDPLIADMLKVYSEEHLAGTPSAASVSYDMERLVEWWGEKTAGEITTDNCRAYIKHRNRPTCCRRELSFLKTAANYWHLNKRQLRRVPAIVKPPRGQDRTRWLTREEAARFLWATRKLKPRQRKRIRRFFIIGWYTGTRHKAITHVSYAMIDAQAKIMLRRPPGVAETKKRTPPVRMGQRLLSHVSRWRRLDGPDAEYPIQHGGKPAGRMADAWRKTRKLAGLSDDVTPHTLRHSRATHLMRQAVDPWQAAQSLGMSLQVLQATYGHHHPDWQTDAAEAR